MSLHGRLPRATPESQGVASSALLASVDALDGLRHLHSLMVLRRGHVIAEGWWAPYRADLPHALFSVSKSLTSTAIGLLVEDGLLGLDDRVVDLLPDAAPDTIDERLAAMRVRHLLSMSTGQRADGLEQVGDGHGWARRILGVPVVHDPGTRFMYQTGATYLLAAIVTRLTGERLLDHLTPRLLAPLGIDGATWERSPDGIDVGGFGLSMTTEDLARFGQSYLQGGRWEGRQVLPASWVATATSAQVSNGDPGFPSDWTQGYGFQFWRSRHGGYRADGAFGQLCLVMPDQEVVVAVTAGLEDMQEEVDVVWATLLPSLGRAEPLPDDPEAHAGLVTRLDALRLPTPQGAPDTPRTDGLAGTPFRLDGGGSARLTMSRPDGRLELDLDLPDMAAHVVCGHDRWLEGGRSNTDGLRTGTDRGPSPLAGAFAWVMDDWLRVRAWALDTAIAWDIDLVLDGDRVDLELRQNVALRERPHIRASGSLERSA